MQKIVAVRPAVASAFRVSELAGGMFTRDPANRVYKRDGSPGRLTMVARKTVLMRLRELEEQLGLHLLSASEYNLITELWNSGQYPDHY
jgi:hypothetical protein